MRQKFQHNQYGECELVRIEGVDWIVRSFGSGQQYRVPLSQRHAFIPIQDSAVSAEQSAVSQADVSAAASASRLFSNPDDVGQLLRAIRNGNRPAQPLVRSVPRVEAPPILAPIEEEADSSDTVISDSADDETADNRENANRSESIELQRFDVELTPATHSEVVEPNSVHPETLDQSPESRRLRRAFDSLRTGLSPVHLDTRQFAVGIQGVQQRVTNFLEDIANDGGRAAVIRGAYGHGKTFCLQLLKQLALESGYAVVSTEIDAFENQLAKPNLIYRSLMQHLEFPDAGGSGAVGLVRRARRRIDEVFDTGHPESRRAIEVRRCLEKEIQCKPLAWLLSGLTICEKPELIGLLSCEPGVTISMARHAHVLWGSPRDWPAFSAGTQGDFGSHLISGVSRLTRWLGYRGLVVILDEMEKWQDLDWKAQCRAGNLLGGLIWSASAENGHRICKGVTRRCDHTPRLEHSGRGGGFPFSTLDRCHLGVMIAMTPRGDEGPEQLWSEYGLIEIVDLPEFTANNLATYVRQVFPAYCRAYGITGDLPDELPGNAVNLWQMSVDRSTRLGVQAVMSTLDRWRDSLPGQET